MPYPLHVLLTALRYHKAMPVLPDVARAKRVKRYRTIVFYPHIGVAGHIGFSLFINLHSEQVVLAVPFPRVTAKEVDVVVSM